MAVLESTVDRRHHEETVALFEGAAGTDQEPQDLPPHVLEVAKDAIAETLSDDPSSALEAIPQRIGE